MTYVFHQFKRIITPFRVEGFFPNMLMLIPRLIAGFLLTFVYAPEVFGTPWTPKALGLKFLEVADWFVLAVTDFGTPFDLMPHAFAWSASFTEAFGGILLALGLNTRITSFFITCVMAITIYFREWDDTWSILPTFLFFCIGLFYLGFGSGKFGLDYWFANRKS